MNVLSCRFCWSQCIIDYVKNIIMSVFLYLVVSGTTMKYEKHKNNAIGTIGDNKLIYQQQSSSVSQTAMPKHQPMTTDINSESSHFTLWLLHMHTIVPKIHTSISSQIMIVSMTHFGWLDGRRMHEQKLKLMNNWSGDWNEL